MTKRGWNFGAGPAVLPEEVLQQIREDLPVYENSGTSIIEHSHRGKVYMAVHTEAVGNVRKLLGVPDDYAVLFLQGGATGQFAMIPMNLLGAGQTADYVNTGEWASKAISEAKIIGRVNVAADTAAERPCRIPKATELKWTQDAAYAHITTNETIAGTQWPSLPQAPSPLIADMSSDIFSKPLDVRRFGLIYAGAQKNIGPSGVVLVVMRKDLAQRASATTPKIFRYSTQIENDSMYNTPPTFGIYVAMLVTRWLLAKGGLDAMAKINAEKAKKIYDVLDSGSFYKPTATKDCRSMMNVTWRLPSEDLEKAFVKESEPLGMIGLAGHRSVGGIRASIYNACPPAAVDALVAFMKDFARRNG
jgi:phosphoserine aminotransferase